MAADGWAPLDWHTSPLLVCGLWFAGLKFGLVPCCCRFGSVELYSLVWFGMWTMHLLCCSSATLPVPERFIYTARQVSLVLTTVNSCTKLQFLFLCQTFLRLTEVRIKLGLIKVCKDALYSSVFSLSVISRYRVEADNCKNNFKWHKFRDESAAKYWSRLEFSFPPEGFRLGRARSVNPQWSCPRLCHSTIIQYSLLLRLALLCSHETASLLYLPPRQGCDHNEQLDGDHDGGLGKSCSFHCPTSGFDLLNRLIRIERAWPMPHEKLP